MYYLGHLSKAIYKFSQSHRILGLSINCTLEQAKTAYYKKAHIFHPDKNPDAKAKEQFSQLNKAFEDVKDQIKKDVRPKADKKQEATENSTKSAQQKQQKKANQYNRFHDEFMEDLFEELRTRNKAQRQQRKKQQQQAQENKNKSKTKKSSKPPNEQRKKTEQPDMHVRVELTPQQFGSGCIKDIKLEKNVECQCRKNGSPSCKICKGRGFKIQFIQGYGSVQEPCIKCHGQGSIRYACRSCKGKGTVNKQFVERVRIPAGAIPGSILNFKGKGQAANGKIGDLNIKLMTKVYGEKKDNDFYTNLKISIAQAVLGTQVTVDTMYGQKVLDIPRGTKHGQMLTIKGYGFETGKGGKSGNHYVTVLIDIPQNISQREEELYEELKQARRKRSQEY